MALIACHMELISSDVGGLSLRDIQAVETRMDGHHSGTPSMSPQTDVLHTA